MTDTTYKYPIFVIVFLLSVAIYVIYQVPYRRIYTSAPYIGKKQVQFLDVMTRFPWNSYRNALKTNKSSEISQYSKLLLLQLVPIVRGPPPIEVNLSCKAPPLQTHLLQPSCKPLSFKRKIGILLQFGFDLDALEIHLNEVNAFVEIFFITESLQAHSTFLTTKPLMWEMVKHDDRFTAFLHKIVHFVVDDADVPPVSPKKMWSIEGKQQQMRWQKFLEWNNGTKFFNENDLLGFGDVDEIPHRDNVAYLKNCQLPSDPIDVGIWFPFGGTDTVFASDFPVKTHKFTYGDPTFWTVGAAIKYYSKGSSYIPSRNRGRSSKYLLGGMHLSQYAFPPFRVIKLLTATEMTQKHINLIIEVGMLYANNRSRDAEDKLNYVSSEFSKRIQSVSKLRQTNPAEVEAIVKIPWYLNCNRERFPSFFRRRDGRLF